MMKNKIIVLGIIAVIIVTIIGFIATKIISERRVTERNIASTQLVEILSEDNTIFLTAIAALPTPTLSNELVEKVHVRYILTSDKITANDVLMKLNSGSNWSEVCKQYSLDKITVETDCDLGWFPRNIMVKELEILAFNTPIGEFGGPEYTIYGWVVIQVLGREMRPYSEVSN